ncbi:MAG: DNA-directed RNA polymerase subunit omega [Candidatus Hydrogenedentota bacterium]|nr:MAG: DNA-directed RNA polymerase subunit omega [Candidatus Hydrogenedentota bacterium]
MEVIIEKLLEATEGSKYVLAAAASLRAKQINAGGKIFVDAHGEKPDVIALQELAQGRIRVRLLTPEERALKAGKEAPKKKEKK